MNEPNFLSEHEEGGIEEVIKKWQDAGLVDFSSRTLRDDFPQALAHLERSEIHREALEEVFRALMEIHFDEGVDKQYLKTRPKNVFAVLRREEELEFDIFNRFFVDLIEQMRTYYGQFLEWKGA